jgi:alkyl hydroperoxide reductase 1
LKDKGVDIIAVIAANDPFVMSGWARVEGLKDKVSIGSGIAFV